MSWAISSGDLTHAGNPVNMHLTGGFILPDQISSNVPEPGTYAMLLSGLVLCCVFVKINKGSK